MVYETLIPQKDEFACMIHALADLEGTWWDMSDMTIIMGPISSHFPQTNPNDYYQSIIMGYFPKHEGFLWSISAAVCCGPVLKQHAETTHFLKRPSVPTGGLGRCHGLVPGKRKRQNGCRTLGSVRMWISHDFRRGIWSSDDESNSYEPIFSGGSTTSWWRIGMRFDTLGRLQAMG